MTVDPEGGVYIAGGRMPDNRSEDFLLWKFNGAGDLAWRRVVGDSLVKYWSPTAMEQGPSGGPVVLSNRGSDANPLEKVVVAFDTSGAILWYRPFRDSDGLVSGTPAALAMDSSGHIYVTGIATPSPVHSRDYDILTVKLSPDGDPIWSRLYKGPDNNEDEPRRILVGPDGGVYIGGVTMGADARYDAIILRYDSLGNFSWSARYDSGNGWTEEIQAMAVDDSSNVVAVGWTDGDTNPIDFLVFGASGPGAGTWARQIDTAGLDSWYDVAVGPDRSIVCAGLVQYVGVAMSDVALAKLTPAGETIWMSAAIDFPTEMHDDLRKVVVDPSGNIYGLGSTLVWNGDRDLLLVGYSPGGDFHWAVTHEPRYYMDVTPVAMKFGPDGNLYTLSNGSMSNGFSTSATLMKFATSGASAIGSSPRDATGVRPGFVVTAWPNPSREGATISYHLSARSRVTVTIYSLLGQLIERLSDEIQPAGMYAVTWNAGDLASGCYIYSVVAGDRRTTGKLFHLR